MHTDRHEKADHQGTKTQRITKKIKNGFLGATWCLGVLVVKISSFSGQET
jgi:hypothetical protein